MWNINKYINKYQIILGGSELVKHLENIVEETGNESLKNGVCEMKQIIEYCQEYNIQDKVIIWYQIITKLW